MGVKSFDDCLYLLDGRLNCLSTLIIYVHEIAYTIGTIDNTVSIILNYYISRKKKLVNSIDKYCFFFIERTSQIETLLINLVSTRSLL